MSSARELPTRAYQANGATPSSGSSPRAKKPTHCSIGEHAGGAAGSQFAAELAGLLRRRLRFVSLVILVPCLLYLFVHLFQGMAHVPHGLAILAVHAITVGLISWLAAILWL